MTGPAITEYQRTLRRLCKGCGRGYAIGDYLESSGQYFERPFDYRAGCETYCLACWLDAGSEESSCGIPSTETYEAQAAPSTFSLTEVPADYAWPGYEQVYEQLIDGKVLSGWEGFIRAGAHIAVMPISRTTVSRPVFYPGGFAFYPPGSLDLDQFSIAPVSAATKSLAERQSLASGVDRAVFDSHPLVVSPCGIDWQHFRQSNHAGHMDLIRAVSEIVDRGCLDFLRYRLCKIEPIDALPGRAGQVNSNPMMAGVLICSPQIGESRLIGGAAFTHVLTRGLGLPMRQLEWDEIPAHGEVGNIVAHGLSLYTALLEANSPTLRFIQALSILEFLAYPDEYRKFEDVKKIISRYVAKDHSQYQALLDRFLELTGKKDPDSGRIIGFRTQVVHIGKRLEDVVPAADARRQLFIELDGYIRAVIDHMISHSERSFAEYQSIRDQMRPFDA